MEGTHASQVDAILGALTMPDIGQLFPDNDPRLQVRTLTLTLLTLLTTLPY